MIAFRRVLLLFATACSAAHALASIDPSLLQQLVPTNRNDNNLNVCDLSNDLVRKNNEMIVSRRDCLVQTVATISATTVLSSSTGILTCGIPPAVHAAEVTPGTQPQSTINNVHTVPTVLLGKSNLRVSRTIQGYWQLAGGHGKYRESDAVSNMEAHYQNGVTTLDTAGT